MSAGDGMTRACLLALCIIMPSQAVFAADQLVPDGGTTTSATTASSGKITVKIAPAGSNGLSHNTYTSFNVPQAGVDLQNTAVNAATILNEVTSTNRTSILGTLQVLGSAAHVIIANPNGITVDGGKFVNAGGVGLITGRLKSNGTNPVFSVSAGDIVIGAGGLTAAIAQLDLISKTLRIEGSITDPRDDKKLAIYTNTGSQDVTLAPKTSRSTPDDWLTVVSKDAANTDVTVTVEKGAVLSGGSIKITVNDKGAGVKIAGEGYASAGEFWITSTGKIEIKNAILEAKENLFVAGTHIDLKSVTSQTRLKVTDTGIKLDASGDISSDGVVYEGNIRSDVGFDSIGAISLRAGGAISLARSERFNSIFTGTKDSIEISAEGNLSDDAGVFNTATDTLLSSGAELRLRRSVLKPGVNGQFEGAGAVLLDEVDIKAKDSILLYADSLAVTSGNFRRSELIAEDGGVFIRATRDVVNQGSLIQGKTRVKGVDAAKGAVTVLAGGKFVNSTTGENRIASFFAKDDNLYIEIDGDIFNSSGRLLSNKSIILKTKTKFSNDNLTVATPHSYRGGQQGNFFAGKKNRIYDYGQLAHGREISQITAIDGVTITAAQFINDGGEVTGNNVTITAPVFKNQPKLLGLATLSRSCFLMFCKTRGTANVTRDGGVISAAELLKINATSGVKNLGGTFIGTDGISITSPSIYFGGQLIPNFYRRTGGLHDGLLGGWGKLFYAYRGGIIVSQDGEITFDTDEEVELVGTGVISKKEINSNQKVIELENPPNLSTLNETRIGLFPDFFF